MGRRGRNSGVKYSGPDGDRPNSRFLPSKVVFVVVATQVICIGFRHVLDCMETDNVDRREEDLEGTVRMFEESETRWDI